ncbi:MAG: replicative DNA helicase [Phycisphaerales bacterium]|nr:MAG: replicative DNA helicase [Phycisphaerales bacterium]
MAVQDGRRAQNGGRKAAEKKNGSGETPMLRSMPESLPAEAAVIGSMIVDPRCIGDVIEVLDREAFYHTEHQLIFDAVVALYEKNRGEGIDGVLVRDELARHGQLDQIGGLEYLRRVIETVPSAANVIYYAEIVREKMLLRETIAAATEILNNAYDESGTASEKLDEAERRIFSVTNKRITSSAEALKDLVTRTFELIEKREGTHVTGLSTGYYELDDLTCGLQKGEMIIVAGRPSMGKTAFALNVAEHIGIIDKTPLVIFSLEMGKQQLAERFLCSYSGVDAQLVRKGMLDTAHYQKLVEGCGVISEAPIFIDDTPALSPLEMRAKARRLKRTHDIQCIMIDYLQLMHLGAGKVESRQQEISAISRYLKSLARELNVPVVVLSQLNRAAEGREGHRPRMSDLRESGSIEQDADVIMLLHREDYYQRGVPDYEPNHTAEVIIAKQRNGPTDTVKLTFLEKCTRFENLSQIEQEAVPF